MPGMLTTKVPVLVWEGSIRVFHWLFAGVITAALGFALIAGEHSALFRWHMVCGNWSDRFSRRGV